MRVISCAKRQADEDADAASALDRLAELSDRVKRVKRSPIANVDAFDNLVSFSQYYNDDFHSESDSDNDVHEDDYDVAIASDYSTGKDLDSEESPPIELEIQDIRVTKASRSKRKQAKKKSSTKSSSRHGAPSKRLAQGLLDLSQCVTALMHGGDEDFGSRTLRGIQGDPSGVVGDLNVSLTAFRQVMDTIRTAPFDDLRPVVNPTLEKLWETAQKLSRQEARMNLACWRNAAGDLRTQLQSALSPSNSSVEHHRMLLERCLDFMSSVSLCDLVRDESTDIRNLAIQETSDHLCRRVGQHNMQRFESMATDVRDLAEVLRRESAPYSGTEHCPSYATPSHYICHEGPSPPSSPRPVEDRPVKRVPNARASGCNVCGDDASSTDVVMACDNNCGKLYHAACLDLTGPPDEGSWYCPDCMESLGLSGDGQVFLCAALHCKRISVTRYCAVHSCRFKGCNFRLRGRGYCRRHDTHQKRSMASD
ncbi:hypothetical protein B5M09_003940 [Aphanomyces astaci]|uniref:PHD-type domain-containing protein n=1 Tax=Aphanomyces astaci TaxID=112090 RepID=A0A3R7X6F1_APHAT|nr:hypothetical protein B5M09_003940 [Aphanomyces astaci]